MSSQENHPRLVVEGGIQVLYKGVWVKEIPFDRDEMMLGVIDPDNDIFPDINLRQYRLEGGDPYISRRHAKFIRKEGKYYIEDICKNNSTSIDTKSNILNGERRELVPGMRVFISESIALRFEVAPEIPEPQETPKEESKEPMFYLEVENKIPLFFKPHNMFTHMIELCPGEWKKDSRDGNRAIQIGRRSTEDGIYPDIDLWKFYFNDGDEYIARRHARIFERDGKLFFQDLSGKGSTWYNVRDDSHRLVRTDTDEASHEIQVGDKLIISDSAVFIVQKRETLLDEEVPQEQPKKQVEPKTSDKPET